MANEDTFHLGVKALIRNKKGWLLVLHANMANLTKGETDHWDLPGGRLQKGQYLEETLRREVEEEIGVKDIKIHELLDASISKMRVHFEHGLILFTFLCSINEKREVKLTDDEQIMVGWSYQHRLDPYGEYGHYEHEGFHRIDGGVSHAKLPDTFFVWISEIDESVTLVDSEKRAREIMDWALSLDDSERPNLLQ